MIIKTAIISILFSAIGCGINKKDMQLNASENAISTDFYSYTCKTIDGKEYNLSELKGKKVMIVNVASHCGYTPQYKGLQELYMKYKDQNFVILGFPCNQFMGQEPGSNSEIQEYCQKNYGVTFPMFEKVDVKGSDQAPIFQWLTKKSLNGVQDAEVSWNFNKFLIDENGKFIAHHKSGIEPNDKNIISFIEGK